MNFVVAVTEVHLEAIQCFVIFNKLLLLVNSLNELVIWLLLIVDYRGNSTYVALATVYTVPVLIRLLCVLVFQVLCFARNSSSQCFLVTILSHDSQCLRLLILKWGFCQHFVIAMCQRFAGIVFSFHYKWYWIEFQFQCCCMYALFVCECVCAYAWYLNYLYCLCSVNSHLLKMSWSSMNFFAICDVACCYELKT